MQLQIFLCTVLVNPGDQITWIYQCRTMPGVLHAPNAVLIPFSCMHSMDSVYLEIACDVCDTEIINIMATLDQNPRIGNSVDYDCPKRGCGSKTFHVTYVHY